MNQIDLSYEADLSPESVWLTVTASAFARNGMMYAQELGDFIAGSKYYTKRRNLPSYLIKYTLSGEGILEYDERIYNVKPGQLFFIDCMKPQHYRTAPGSESWHIIWAHFYGGAAAQYYHLFNTANNGNLTDIPPESRALEHLYRLLSLYRKEGDTMTDIFSAEALTGLVTEAVAAGSSRVWGAAIPEYVREARAFLTESYAQKITLEDIALRFNMNRFHFQKQFKRYTGYTPHEFITLVRLNAAKAMLRNTGMSINEIASDIGMDNSSHFISLFKRFENATPHAYRRNWNSLNKG